MPGLMAKDKAEKTCEAAKTTAIVFDISLNLKHPIENLLFSHAAFRHQRHEEQS
jgi:hypothetical protein